MTSALFGTVLVANRGEIAVRVMRTLRTMGIRTATVYSDADIGARHVIEADAAVRIGPAAPAESYLNIDRVIGAAQAVGADALHPGYGFLAENAELARACAAAGIVFIGPPAEAIEVMGDKIRAKQTVSAAGVPVVPGRGERGLSDEDLGIAIETTGYPALIKPSAGGGGKGMHLVTNSGEVRAAIVAARAEAMSSFGDDTLLIERFVERPRHIEIQVMADEHGNVVSFGERECSLQRRHQKIIEETPSPFINATRRDAMGVSAVAAARACGYVSAGTVEFIVSAARPEEFFFMEMNTRLQVEHPVTEMVYGVDLVELQVRVAAGEPLAFEQSAIVASGHAVEARVYAEDPARQFLPTGGHLLELREPSGPGIRVDSGWREGGDVGSFYDPMLAKVIAHAPDRAGALARLDRALAETVALGVHTNLGFLRVLLAHPDVQAGDLDTGLVERELDSLVAVDVPDDVVMAFALGWLVVRGGATQPWEATDGWRFGPSAWTRLRVEVTGRGLVEVRVRGDASAAEVAIDGGDPVSASASLDGDDLVVTASDVAHRFAWAREGATTWLSSDAGTWTITEPTETSAGQAATAVGSGSVKSPMPGVVVAVNVSIGDAVTAGQPLVVVEAMKMHHSVEAAIDGIVTALPVSVGQQVVMDETLAVVSPPEPE